MSSNFPPKRYRVFLTSPVSIGNPPQSTYVEIDTGSSELWVNANCSTAPTDFGEQQICEGIPTYDPTKSTSVKGPIGSSQIVYGSTGENLTGVDLDYYLDTIDFGNGLTLTGQQFGVAENSLGLASGIMGLSPNQYSGFAVNQSYLLVLDSLVAQNQINSRAYSLNLGHINESAGEECDGY